MNSPQKPLKVRVLKQHRFLGLNFCRKKVKILPRNWAEFKPTEKIIALRLLMVMPKDDALVEILRRILGLNTFEFSLIDPLSISAALEVISFLNDQNARVFNTFQYKGKLYATPPQDFLGVAAFEFALADDYYNEWAEGLRTAPEIAEIFPLLRLFALLCRPYSEEKEGHKTDTRAELSYLDSDIDIDRRAQHFESIDPVIVNAVVREFEALKEKVHKLGVAADIFPKKTEKEDAEDADDAELKKQQPDDAAPFGWWSVFRTVAKNHNKTEEQVWATPFWRVFQILIEEKKQAKMRDAQGKIDD